MVSHYQVEKQVPEAVLRDLPWGVMCSAKRSSKSPQPREDLAPLEQEYQRMQRLPMRGRPCPQQPMGVQRDQLQPRGFHWMQDVQVQ